MALDATNFRAQTRHASINETSASWTHDDRMLFRLRSTLVLTLPEGHAGDSCCRTSDMEPRRILHLSSPGQI